MRYGLFEVVGLELEYPVVDDALRVVAGVEELFRRLHGRATSSVALDGVELSNELAAHVLEIKNVSPQSSSSLAEEQLHEGLTRAWEVLERDLGLGLMPTGMHPFMGPAEGKLWQRAGRRIYETYARIFDIRQHGWLNVQSCHVNLPFGEAGETPLVHNALTLLVPYLPALAASSPIVEGEPHGRLDARLAFYRVNQREIPEITGDVVPDYMRTPRSYRRQVLDPIYARLDRIADSDAIRNEFIDSRAVIPKFYRDSLEVRVLDMQECVRMDAAIAAFLRAAARRLYERLRRGDLDPPPHRLLVEDFEATLRDGRAAAVRAPHLGGPATAGEVLGALLEPAAARLAAGEEPCLDLVQARLRNGCLAERILEAVEARSAAYRESAAGEESAGEESAAETPRYPPGVPGAVPGDVRSPSASREALSAAITSIYRELIDALRHNRPWRLGPSADER